MAKEKIKFTQDLLDFYGKPVKAPDTSAEPTEHVAGPNGAMPVFPTANMTLLKCCVNAVAMMSGDEKISGEQKQKRWRIGAKIAKAAINKTGEVSMKADEITEILKCTDAMYHPLVAGCIRAMLDPSEEDQTLLDGLGKTDQPEREPT